MAGKAIERSRIAELDKLGEEKVFEMYVELGSVPKIVNELFPPKNGEKPGKQAFYSWLHADPERWERWQALKPVRAEIEVDLAHDEAHAATPENVQVQRLKVDTHKWRAGIMNREYRSGQSAVNVNMNVSVGMAWLEALKEKP